MADVNGSAKYDEILTQILVNEKSILGFLSTIFNFLARRTDFYYIPQGAYENMGFPPGVAEELVIKVLRTCDPNNWKPPNGAKKPTDINDEIMCSTIAQEVEVVADDECEIEENTDTQTTEPLIEQMNSLPVPFEEVNKTQSENTAETDDSAKPTTSTESLPPVIPTQKNSETYNGAERENYSWAQTIMELDVTVRLPPHIKSSKDLKVTITARDLCVACRNGDVLIKDSFLHKVKPDESIWSISEGKILIHLEKVQERWWNKLLNKEEPIDLSKIDCSRPLYELPDDHIAKVRELQWNQEQKMKGLQTSDQLRNMEILRKAWNAEGSPFKGKEFDPNVMLNLQN
ncbi:nudC domain-containing protein 3 [Pectinophora gossypiella]|uniref:nudC domain-containing protein 3 n=1 Tax=Pectinophora gossypiella TaxID=13191 RepID=UPI00214F2644|nr:nudC domain-containing protein 3 [Pectinophora gossypiella]